VLDRAGLEIRISNFGLNWTPLAASILVFGNSLGRTSCQWTDMTSSDPNFLVRVTF
jgi:hypothetical protein